MLDSETVRRLIDFSEPAAVMMTAVLHFVSDDDDPAGIVARYVAPLAAGSYLALSHTTGDQKPPKAVEAMNEAGRRSAGGNYVRSRDQCVSSFGALEIVPPYEGARARRDLGGAVGLRGPRGRGLRRLAVALLRRRREAGLTAGPGSQLPACLRASLVFEARRNRTYSYFSSSRHSAFTSRTARLRWSGTSSSSRCRPLAEGLNGRYPFRAR